jgi:transcriptional regulator with XRE-family HTH domain
MITIEQCRAARGLLDWTQQDLSEASGLSKTAINNFEKGHSDIKHESLRAIRMAFESADIEFLEHGLRRRNDTVRILKGANIYNDLLDDVIDTLKATGGEILAAGLGQSRVSSEQAARLQNHNIKIRSCDAAEIRIIYGTKIAAQLGGVIVILDSLDAAKTERQKFEEMFPAEETRGQKNRAF